MTRLSHTLGFAGVDQYQQIMVRSMLTKPGWSHLELRTFRGVLTHLNRTPRDD